MFLPKDQRMTLLFPVTQENVLLGMKKTSLGKGWWNAFGGKVEFGESIEDAAVRELVEESALTTTTANLLSRGYIDFYFSHKPKWNQQVHLFVVEEFSGVPVETREMNPEWFSRNALPYEQMWPADNYFIPRILKGETIHGEIHFSPDGQKGKLTSSTGEVIEF